MSFAGALLEEAEPYIEAQVQKPYLQGIINGDLPQECFEYWLKVDYPYLYNFLKVLALGVVKAEDPQDMWVMMDHMQDIQREMRDHESHAARLGMTREDHVVSVSSSQCSRYDREEPPDHETFLRAARNAAANSGLLIGPARWATIFPFASRTYVSGTCEIPYLLVTSPEPSASIKNVRPWASMNVRASEVTS